MATVAGETETMKRQAGTSSSGSAIVTKKATTSAERTTLTSGTKATEGKTEVESTNVKAASKTKVKSKTKAGAWKNLDYFIELKIEDKLNLLAEHPNGYCVADGITLVQFHRKCKNSEATGFRMEYKTGKAFIYEVPTAAHDDAAGEIVYGITSRLCLPRAGDFSTGASPRCDRNDDESFEPDGTVCLMQRSCDGTPLQQRPGPGHASAADPAGNRWPNVIIEVAMIESEQHVRDKALRWLAACNDPNFCVQQVIVVKIGPTPRSNVNESNGTHSMKAWRYARGALNTEAFDQFFEFGIPNNPGEGNMGATATGQMMLHIPTAALYAPIPVPNGLPDTIDVDLFFLRNVIENKL